MLPCVAAVAAERVKPAAAVAAGLAALGAAPAGAAREAAAVAREAPTEAIRLPALHKRQVRQLCFCTGQGSCRDWMTGVTIVF